MKRISIKDIATKAGVVPSTVSFVLNGKAKEMRISDAMAEKIVAVAKAEGYAPNHIAVSLRTGRSRILGLIVEDISNPFFAALAKNIEEKGNELGYRIVYCSTKNDSQKGNDLITLLSQSQVDGFIITPLPGMEEQVALLQKQGIPITFMDRYLPGLDVASVLLDNEDGVRLGMQHLLSKGYKRIGFVTVELQQVQMVQRQSAYEQILEERGVAEGEHFILKLPFNYQHDFAVDQIKRFIVDQRLDAILFSTNYLGIMGIESIAQLKLQIPRDLAVVCFDNHDLFKLYPPGITTINQPLQAMAHAAIANLVEQIESGKGLAPKHIQLKAELIVRGST
ncbi:LacI family DNA-binding transcriptional regulator [Flavisolibacter sp. BT320]|nr:LacI family DNA-binding transcriptional regulator [Flavisolibacter longurius]